MDVEDEQQQVYVMEIQEPCSSAQIQVVEGVNRGHGIAAYVGYIVKMTHPIKNSVQRRYRQFDALRVILVQRWPGVFIPCLPRKHTSRSNSIKVVKERVKYLTHFLNCCAKMEFIFASEQFQLFLTSPCSDLKALYQKMQKTSFEQLLVRYRLAFPQIVVDVNKKKQIDVLVAQIVDPFQRQLKENRITLINLKKQVHKLAVRRQEYIKNIGILYNEALPSLENYISSITVGCQVVLTSNAQLKEKAADFKLDRMQIYWLLYEALRLQIGQSQAALEALEARVILRREEDRLYNNIVNNQQEINDVKAKRMTLKQFFSRNVDQLARQLQAQNKVLIAELQSMRLLICYVNQVILSRLTVDYRMKRQIIWKNAWRRFIKTQISFNAFLAEFYSLVCSQN